MHLLALLYEDPGELRAILASHTRNQRTLHSRPPQGRGIVDGVAWSRCGVKGWPLEAKTQLASPQPESICHFATRGKERQPPALGAALQVSSPRRDGCCWAPGEH